MLRNYSSIFIAVLFILTSSVLIAQEVKYKNVILDGKPARINVTTGEITLLEIENKTSIERPEKSKDTLTTGFETSQFHIVKEGETLLDISEMYNVSLVKLKKANGLETTLVDSGQKIQIRNFSDLDSTKIQKLKNRRIKNFNSDFHTVREGETLYSIAKRYGLKLEDLKLQNELVSNTIRIGQKLQIRNFDLTKDLNSITIWVVKKGDTLYSIAKKTGTTITKLKHLNGLKNDTIKVGQKLLLK